MRHTHGLISSHPSQTMAVEWAADGVRVNAVAPGIIASKTAADNYGIDVFAIARPAVPSKRPGIPDEVSGVVAFLLSPAASFISGTCVNVDSGSSLYTQLFWNIDGMESLAFPKLCKVNDDERMLISQSTRN